MEKLTQTYYQVTGWIKYAEKDNWKGGCNPDITSDVSGHDVFKALTVKDLITHCQNFVGSHDFDDCLLDSCEQNGRLDISVLENDDGETAYMGEIDQWKAGKIDLWYSTYTFYVGKITSEEIILKDFIPSSIN